MPKYATARPRAAKRMANGTTHRFRRWRANSCARSEDGRAHCAASSAVCAPVTLSMPRGHPPSSIGKPAPGRVAMNRSSVGSPSAATRWRVDLRVAPDEPAEVLVQPTPGSEPEHDIPLVRGHRPPDPCPSLTEDRFDDGVGLAARNRYPFQSVTSRPRADASPRRPRPRNRSPRAFITVGRWSVRRNAVSSAEGKCHSRYSRQNRPSL